MTSPVSSVVASLALALLLAAPVQAQRPAASESSTLSLLPVAVLSAAPAVLLSGVGALTVVSVEATANGSAWVLQRAADGSRFTLQSAGGVSRAAGTVVEVTALGTGWLLSAAGQAIAFVPNAVGTALLHNERVTP